MLFALRRSICQQASEPSASDAAVNRIFLASWEAYATGIFGRADKWNVDSGRLHLDLQGRDR